VEKNKALAKLFVMLHLLTITCGFAATPALATTPVRFRLVQNQIITSVLVNGTGPFDFVFDTGASSTVIDSELVKQLSLSAIDSESVHTVTGSKTVYRYRVDSLALGPKTVRSLTVLCAEPRDMHAMSPKVRGVLGQNFLSEFDYILNYRDQRIEFEEGGEYARKLQGARLPVERDRGRILITTQPSSPQKRASKLVMDSGVSNVVVFTSSTKADLEIELDVNGGINASTMVGSQIVSTGRLRNLQIGTEKFSWLPVRVVDNSEVVAGRPEDGLLPTSLFRSIYFNNTQNFVILNPRLPTRVLTSSARGHRDESSNSWMPVVRACPPQTVKTFNDPTRTHSTFVLSKINEQVTSEFLKAWNHAHNGIDNIEAALLIFENLDGSYRAIALRHTNEANKVTFKWDPAAIAIVHTHPSRVDPKPSSEDMRIADKFGVPILTLTSSGAYMYDPSTRRITQLQNNLDWLEPSSWVQASGRQDK